MDHLFSLLNIIGPILTGFGLFFTGIASVMSFLQSMKNAKELIKVIDKVDIVKANVDGHLSKITDLLGAVDPSIAAKAAAEVLATAKEVKTTEEHKI